MLFMSMFQLSALTVIPFTSPLHFGATGVSVLLSLAGLASSPLSSEQERTIRRLIISGPPALTSPNKGTTSLPSRVVEIPEVLLEMYKKHPLAVLQLCLRIVDGANSLESVTAATYALALLRPGGGVVCSSFFDNATYDVIDQDWGVTPRNHWIERIKTAMRVR